MPSEDDLDRLNRKIAATADHMARHRELIDQMRVSGKDVVPLEAALDALAGLYRYMLRERQAHQGPESKAD